MKFHFLEQKNQSTSKLLVPQTVITEQARQIPCLTKNFTWEFYAGTRNYFSDQTYWVYELQRYVK